MWYVHKTACFPKQYKINRSKTDEYAGSNGPDNYFTELHDAVREVLKRNQIENLQLSE